MAKESNFVVPEGKIIDFIDEKIREDTPEEYVRQQIEKSIILEYEYLREVCAVEFPIKMGTAKKRADIVIFDEDKKKIQENINIIIECKEEKVSSSSKKEGVGQLKTYMAASPNCNFGLWTNSIERFVFKKNIKNKKIIFDEIIDIPKFKDPLDKTEKPELKDLRKAIGDNLKFSFRRCHDYIAGNQGLQKPEAFWELLKIIFCKIFDERQGDINFFVTSDERSSLNGQLKIKKRIDKIFSDVLEIQEYKNIFEENEKIKLDPRVTAFIVSQLQNYSLLESEIDVKGAAYEEIVGSNLRGDRGEFFTPRNVCSMVISMINPKINEKIIDPSCGTGGFLTIAMNHVIEKIKNKSKNRWKNKFEPSDNERMLFFNEIKRYTENNVYGLDLNPNLVKACKMNMVLNNDGSGSLFQSNSLENHHKLKEEFRNKLNITSSESLGKFDVVITNPPFGSKIPIDDPNILEQYELGFIWEKKDNKFIKTDRLQKSVPPEILFIERCVNFLKVGGRMGIVLPDAILGAPGLQYVRYWLLNNTQILASIDLHKDTFQPKNGTQTSVLIVKKKSKSQKEEEIKTPVFISIVEKVGHDKRGKTIFKRDDFGNEIIEKKEKEILIKKNKSKQVGKVLTKDKIIDDQTTEVAKIFELWKKTNKDKFKEFDF
tara:strand:+ start:345 stop:2315 length:1971 start_codon:yes stop_codon:yes gene_type:complete